eukprot:SAG31_NODE_31167_length_371_cov_0.937500_1_plen_84_part_00
MYLAIVSAARPSRRRLRADPARCSCCSKYVVLGTNNDISLLNLVLIFSTYLFHLNLSTRHMLNTPPFVLTISATAVVLRTKLI